MDSVTVLENLKQLEFSVKNISKLTGIPAGRIYQWYAKRGNPKYEDYNKLKDLYERMKPNPTNDFHGDIPNLAAEDQAPYLSPQEQIKLLKESNEMKDQKIIELKQELQEYKSKVVDVGKTGGRRNSS